MGTGNRGWSRMVHTKGGGRDDGQEHRDREPRTKEAWIGPAGSKTERNNICTFYCCKIIISTFGLRGVWWTVRKGWAKLIPTKLNEESMQKLIMTSQAGARLLNAKLVENDARLIRAKSNRLVVMMDR
ncbi:hypothetical protein BGZ61DRAFT_26516 [Ilyonectria robusta]|uniref:uncharacterized protein n=1 Tax=Ilyonectria robusta TaxID=1079257 RepID=UPI001E8E6146|nr:uncharacterized protein BGZ61DRAFT_26516 [Ilyonectria robusta]KAH8738014.1 hypothetical protein BGZ61DRAFT_26516 [Ilyonectria robusta]